MARLIQLAIGLALIGALLWPLEQWFPSIAEKKVIRKGFRVDLVYWFFTPTVTAAFTYGVTIVTAVLIIVLSGGSLNRGNLISGRPPISSLPLVLQHLTALLAADFLGYWGHRLFHLSGLWPFHAVHHSSEELDWLSSVRLHPVNQALGQLIVVAPMALLGFNLQTLGTTAGILTFWAIFVHSNTRWTFGPLRHVLTTPAFHRWHHTSETEGLDKNFAGLLLLWDRVFGTFYMPHGKQPQRFGLAGSNMPNSFLRQIAWPFLRETQATKHAVPLAGEQLVQSCPSLHRQGR